MLLKLPRGHLAEEDSTGVGSKYIIVPKYSFTNLTLLDFFQNASFENSTFYRRRLLTILIQYVSSIRFLYFATNHAFSLATLLTNTTGTIQNPASFGLTNTTTRQNALDYLSKLTSNCGTQPANAAPYAGAVAPTPWASWGVAQASAATAVVRATSVPSA